jgi:myo-inositol 2-dehydrogenase / D-chiro-inositol 1-dehydrogenase
VPAGPDAAGLYRLAMTSIAFAGAGAISAVHGLAAKAAGLTPTAVASRRPATAAARAEQMGARPVSYDELPAGADIVVVCTPPAVHVDDAIRALQGGAAVLVEKPLATTLADADRLVVAAAGARGRVGYAENLAHAPAVTAALARRPGLGPITHLEARVVQPPPPWGEYRTVEWGGGVLFDVGPHPLALALLLARPARPVEVTARLAGGEGHPTDEHADVTVGFDSGLQAALVVSWRSGGEVLWDVQAAAGAGVLRVELLPHAGLEADGEPVPLPPPPAVLPDARLHHLGYLDQLRCFAADVAARRDPAMDAAFGREVLEILCAAYASAGRGGEPTALPFTGSRHRTPLQLWRG